MKLQNKSVGQLTEDLNELKLKIAKINARRNAQIDIVKRDLDRRSMHNGTLLRSHHLYPSYYYSSPSSYRYSLLYPRYRSLENLSSDQYYEKPYKKSVTFTKDYNDGTNLRSSATSASMSDLLSKLKDFVFEQEKQLTSDLLNKIAESRRAESLPRSTTSHGSLKDLTASDLFLNPVNKKDNFYKRYNAYAKRILKPMPTLSTHKSSTYKPLWMTQPWLENDYNYYLYDEPPWARWYRRYLTSPRYRHHLSDYNYYTPKLLTLPSDIESIVGDKAKSINHPYDTRSISPDNKLYNFRYDPFESDSYLKPRLPNWKQYYYTHKLKSKSSNESYLQDYDPHYDFFPDVASVDSTDELSNNPQQLLDDYTDAIYEDVIQNLRNKQLKQQSNTFPRRRPRSVQRSLSPTFSTKYYSQECGDLDQLTNKSHDFDTSSTIKSSCRANISANESKISSNTPELKKYDLPELHHDRKDKDNLITDFPSAITGDNYKPLFRPSAVRYAENVDTENVCNNRSSDAQILARTTGVEFTPRLKYNTSSKNKDVYRPVYQPQSSTPNAEQFSTDLKWLNHQVSQNSPLGMLQEKEQIPIKRRTSFTENARENGGTTGSNEIRRPSRQPLFTEYEERLESDAKPPNIVEQNTSISYRNKIKEEPAPAETSTTTSENVEQNSVVMDNDVCRLLQPQSSIESDDAKPFNPVAQNSSYRPPDNKEVFKEIPEGITQSHNTYSIIEKPLSPSKNKKELHATSPSQNTPSTSSFLRRNSSQLVLNRRDSMRMPQNLTGQPSADQVSKVESIPSANQHLMTEFTNYTNNYSTPNQSYPQVVDPENNSTFIPLRRRSSQIIISPAVLESSKISFSSANPSRRESSHMNLEQVGNSSEPSQMTRSSFRRQSSLAPLTVQEDYDPSRHSNSVTRSYPYKTERRVSMERQPHIPDQFANYPPDNVYQSAYYGQETMRDPDESYKNTDLSEPIYEQHEENHIDYYYDNNYRPTHSEADHQRYEGDDDVSRIVQVGPATDYNESNAVYESYEPPYHQDKYGNDENFPITGYYYDPNMGTDTHHPQGQNNEHDVKYSVQGVSQNYNDNDAYDSNTTSGGYYVQDTFPVEYEYTADENRNITATDSGEPIISEPQEVLENKEPADHRLSENKGTKKLLETTQPEELNMSNNKINARDRKKSVDNEVKTREPISRRASKISLQSSVDDKKSRTQLTASGSESLKRISKVKPGENKLKRTSSTVSKTKTPISKRT